MLNLLLIVSCTQIYAQISPSLEGAQLQRLVERSDQQIQLLKDVIEHKKMDAKYLNQSSQILKKLSEGIDKSIEKYRGTEVYTKALIDFQSKDDFSSTYYESEKLRQRNDEMESIDDADSKKSDNIVHFQKESVRANLQALEKQKLLRLEIEKSEPGYLKKIQAETDIDLWETNTRLSTQMTELISALHMIKEELRANRVERNKMNPIQTLLKGSEIQNKIRDGRAERRPQP